MKSLKISLAPKTWDASQSTRFRSETIDFENLEETMKTHNYSLICWKIKDDLGKPYNRYRKQKNFESAAGIVIDFDKGLGIADAQSRLKDSDINYFIITSKSHQKMKNGHEAVDRYHIIIPFSKQISSKEKYKAVFTHFKIIFPEMDTSVSDLARFIYYSPENAEYYKYLDGEFFDPDEVLDESAIQQVSKIAHSHTWEFDPEDEIKLANGEMTAIKDIVKKEACFCPLPEHQDEKPSAFVDYVESQGRHMIYCMACDALGWSKMNIVCDDNDFYFHGKDIVEFGVSQSQFFATKTSRDAYFILVGANSNVEQQAAFNFLIKNRRLSNVSRVDYIGDVGIEKDEYDVDLKSGVVTVSIASIQKKMEDNAFIENYLLKTFGDNKDFIKKYLAMYVYTNYVQLPTLILHGPRGTSKTTFAEMVGSIYPNLSIDWKGDVSHFTPEAEKKLAIIEENELNAKSQYKILKKYSGQKSLMINKKYQPEYMVRNNLSIMLLSNEPIPIFVEKTEMPTDESNNQFFVWKFPELTGKRDGNFLSKLKDRLGHYIRTELKSVFENIDKNYTRYAIPVPITEYEKELFESNTTNIEASADQALESIVNFYHDHVNSYGCVVVVDDYSRLSNPKGVINEEMKLLDEGYLSFSVLQKFANGGIHPNAMIKNMKKRGIIGEAQRRTVNHKKFSCFEVIDQQYHVKVDREDTCWT